MASIVVILGFFCLLFPFNLVSAQDFTLGQSKINVQEISDTLELSLGRDSKIAISRVKKSERNDHQFIGNFEPRPKGCRGK